MPKHEKPLGGAEFDLSTLKFVNNLPPDQASVQTRAAALVRANPQALVDEYRSRFGDEFNPDNGAELFSDYSSSPETRAKYRVAVAGACGWVIDEAFRQRIAISDRRPVVFSAGGTASGKSILIVDEVKAGVIVLDSTFSNYELSKTRVQEALDSGRNVAIQYVYRDLLEAYGAAIKRSKAEAAGRVVPLETHLSTHANAATTVGRLVVELAGNPQIRFHFYASSYAEGFTRGGVELTRRGDYTRRIIEAENSVGSWIDHEAPALYPKLALEEFTKMGFPEQAEYLAAVALASGNRYRGRADLLIRENAHRNFASPLRHLKRGDEEARLV
jgi:hypothetical protein